jgi:4-hydroxy-tetrahydrodipicolinate synthase
MDQRLVRLVARLEGCATSSGRDQTRAPSGPGLPALFEGVAVALLSLFDDDERVLVPETAELAAGLAAEGVRAVVVAGSTGEPWFLTAEERVALIEATRTAVPDHVPVIAGSGHPHTEEAVRLTRAARDSGADAVMAISPPGRDDPTAYYDAIAEAAGQLPVIAYHFPLVSSPGVPVELLGRLPIAGVKDSSGDVERLGGALDVYGGPIYVGSPLLLTLAGTLGAAGAIVALANLEVERLAAAFAGDGDAQRELLAEHRRAQRDFPRALKQMVADRRGTSAAFRTRPPAGAQGPPWPNPLPVPAQTA